MRQSTWLLSCLLAACAAPLPTDPQDPDRAHPVRGFAQRTEPRPDQPDGAMEWRMLTLRDENGQIPHDADLVAKEQMEALRTEGTAGGLTSTSWTQLGPGNVGGRIRAVWIHPTTTSTLLVGSVGGGIWRSTNSGTSWTPVNDLMTNIAITCIVHQPSNANVLYAGTGEGFYNADAIRGAGIFKSTDGGLNWTRLTATNTSSYYYVNRLTISPDSTTLLAATNSGIFRSTDGGTTFTSVSTSRTLDVKFHPTNSSRVVAARGDGVVTYSTNGGSTWTSATGLGTGARTELCWHRGWTGAGNGCIYAQRYASPNTTLNRSTDGGQTWTLVSTNTITGGQGWYDNALWVDPYDTDANTADDVIVAGGIDLWRSTNGGTSFTKISNWTNSTSPHADHHAIIEGCGGTSCTTVYCGNDGGLWRTSNIHTATTTSGWTNLNNGLQITQFYGGSRNSVNGTMIGGTQDNGTQRRTSGGSTTSWTRMYGGDGGWCASENASGGYHYGEYVYLQIHRSTNDGVSSSYIYSGISDAGSSSGANFIAPFVLDPNDANRMFAGGRSLWRSNNVRATTPSWTAVKATISNNISAVTVAPGNSNLVWVGHNNGNVYVSTNALATTPTWTQRDNGTPALPNRVVTRLVVDPANTAIVYATFGGYNSDNLWKSTNSGVTWAAVSTTLPAAPVRDLEIHPTMGWLYAATEVGLLVSENGGTSWTSTATPANVSIDELFWSSGALYLVTHGRSMYRQTPVTSLTPPLLSLGQPCQVHGGPGGPDLSTSDPRIGMPLVFAVTGAPQGIAMVAVSPMPQGPSALSPGCFLQLDPAHSIVLATMPVGAAGEAGLQLPLPHAPAYVGESWISQAAVVTPASDLFVSNGRVLHFQY